MKQDTFIKKIRLKVIWNTLSAGLQHLNLKFNVFVHRKTVIRAFSFANILSVLTCYLSCQIFFLTCVNWPDKELRSVADSISFSADNIGSDIQRKLLQKVDTQLISIGVTRCQYLDGFPKLYILFEKTVMNSILFAVLVMPFIFTFIM